MPDMIGIPIRDKLYPAHPQQDDGQWNLVGGFPNANYSPMGAEVEIATGGFNASSAVGPSNENMVGIADLTFGATYPLGIKGARGCVRGTRPYVMDLDFSLLGPAPWNNLTALVLQDTSLAPQAYFPAISLDGMGSYNLRTTQTLIPAYLSVASVSGAGVITFANAGTATVNGATVSTSNLVASSTALNNTPFTVVAGTGQGHSGIIGSYTGGNGSTITPITPIPVEPLATVSLDTTSVIAVWYWEATSASTTAVTFSNAFFTTNALDNGFYLVAITSAVSQVQGAVRPAISNTGTAVTTLAGMPFQNAPVAGNVFAITNAPKMSGIVDLSAMKHWYSATAYNNANIGTPTLPGVGLQFNTIGTTPTQGSPIRVNLRMRYAY